MEVVGKGDKGKGSLFQNDMRLVKMPKAIFVLTRNKLPMLCHMKEGLNYTKPKNSSGITGLDNTQADKEVDLVNQPVLCTSRCPLFGMHTKSVEGKESVMVQTRCGAASSHAIIEIVLQEEEKGE